MWTFYKDKKVIVFGGAGFIGSHLCERLLQIDACVTIVDNFHTGSIANIECIPGYENIRVITQDIVDPFPDATGDIIFNLACPASPIHYQHDPIKTLQTSVLGINRVLEHCRDTQTRLVHASTSEVYGDPLEHPQRETYWGNVNPNGIRACYDEGKRAAETLALDYHRVHNVDVRLPRIFNTYGPRMASNDGRVVTSFITQALAGEEITVFGDGAHTRSFCYVSDMIDALLRFGGGDDLAGEVINLGNPNEFTVMELAHRTIDLTGSSSKIGYHDLPLDDPRKRQPDISKAREKLGWAPIVQLEEGLKKTIEYYTEQGDVANLITSLK